MKTAFLVGGGDFFAAGFKPQKDDIIIAVDSGYSYLCDIGIKPHYIIGDFDSLDFVPNGANVEIHPPEKDDTDTMLAVRKAIELGVKRLMLFGCTGGRIAHTLGALQTLCYICEQGCECFIIDEKYVFTALANGSLTFLPQNSGYISLLPWGSKKAEISIRGLKYELDLSLIHI